MAATFFRALVILYFLSTWKQFFNNYKYSQGKLTRSGNVYSRPDITVALTFNDTNRRRARLELTSRNRIRRVVATWSSRGLTLLAVPENMILLDITICCDVERNPGDETEKTTKRKFASYSMNKNFCSKNRIVLSRETLLSFCKFGWKPSADMMQTCKDLGILKYRSRRGGRSRYCSYNLAQTNEL